MTWKVDNAHTAIEFSVRHMMVSTVKGNFTDFAGELELDPDDPGRSRARATIQVASVDTRQAMRDQDLRSANFFDAEQFPVIRYASRAVQHLGGDRYRVEGELTIRDITRPLPLEVRFLGLQQSPWGTRVAGFEASGSLSRKDFGITYNVALETGGLVVGDEVKIRVDAEAVEEVAVPEPAAALLVSA
ncbi:MAG: YceI family protein [Candidatus Dormibacteria bacterium]